MVALPCGLSGHRVDSEAVLGHPSVRSLPSLRGHGVGSVLPGERCSGGGRPRWPVLLFLVSWYAWRKGNRYSLDLAHVTKAPGLKTGLAAWGAMGRWDFVEGD